MHHRAAYAVMVWRSLPHLSAASATTAVVQAVHERYEPAAHVLTGHQLALLQVVVTHIVVCARRRLRQRGQVHAWGGSIQTGGGL